MGMESKVKPLVWTGGEGKWRAETSWGPYLIAELEMYEVGFWWVYDYGYVNQDGEGVDPYLDGDKCHTLKAAKAAAQADHDKRVLASIEGNDA